MSSPDPNVVMPLLEALEITVPGIIQAFGNAPFEVVSVPAVVNIPGAVQPMEMTGGDGLAAEGYEKRQYKYLLLVANSGGGLSGEVIARVNPFYGLLRNLFIAHSTLGDPTSGIFWLEWLGDAGLQTEIEVGGMKYTGTIGTIQVTGRVRVPYAQGE